MSRCMPYSFAELSDQHVNEFTQEVKEQKRDANSALLDSNEKIDELVKLRKKVDTLEARLKASNHLLKQFQTRNLLLGGGIIRSRRTINYLKIYG